MTPSRFDGLSDPQVEALCSVAFGGQGGECRPATLASLVKRGLIVREEMVEPTRFGTFRWSVYSMDIATHIEFCRWCSEHADEPE